MTAIIEIEEGWLAYDKSLEWWSGNAPKVSTDEGAEAAPTNKRGWFLCPHRPRTLWWTTTRNVHSGDFVLTDGYVASEKLPARIPSDRFDYDDWPDGAYRSEVVDTEQERHEVDFAGCRVITPEVPRQLPELPEGARWVPSWKVDMLEDAAVHAWLSGSLVGFRQAFASWLEGQPGVQARFGGRLRPEPKGKWEVDVRLFWSDGRTVKEKQRGKRKLVEKRTWVTHTVDLSSMPDGVQAVGVWSAVERWDALMAEWQARIEVLGAQACAHCNGKGYLVKGAA